MTDYAFLHDLSISITPENMRPAAISYNGFRSRILLQGMELPFGDTYFISETFTKSYVLFKTGEKLNIATITFIVSSGSMKITKKKHSSATVDPKDMYDILKEKLFGLARTPGSLSVDNGVIDFYSLGGSIHKMSSTPHTATVALQLAIVDVKKSGSTK